MNTDYEVAIVGGGLAGLTLGVQLQQAGVATAIFEKKTYPFHRVCGEYISLESWDFLLRLGLPLADLHLPRIRRLRVSSPRGRVLAQPLTLGAFGISRYTLDHLLAQRFRALGGALHERCTVTEVTYEADTFTLTMPGQTVRARVVAGAFGKRAAFDRTRNPRADLPARNYVGVKYHLRNELPADVIELHNFRGGYCGLSQIEDGKVCCCYLTDAASLRRAGSIEALETEVLMRNPFLKGYFRDSEFLFDAPVTVSQVQIGPRAPVADHVLRLGDAAGFVAPLSGNGMSMAMRASALLAPGIEGLVRGRVGRADLEAAYTRQWNAQFRQRIRLSAWLQRLLVSERATDLALGLLDRTPGLLRRVIKGTHGQPF